MSRASRASRVALGAPKPGRSGVKGVLLRLRPSHLLPALPADPCRRSVTLAPSRKLCPLQRAGTFPWNLYNSRRGRALWTRRGSSVYLRRPFSPLLTTTRSSERRPWTLNFLRIVGNPVSTHTYLSFIYFPTGLWAR